MQDLEYLETKSVYAPNPPSLNSETIAEYFAKLTDTQLDAALFQLALDLKSIESQFYASRHRYFTNNTKPDDKAWYAKMRSVQAIKVTQLMCAEKELEHRIERLNKEFFKAISDEKSENEYFFYKKFYEISCKYLDSHTLDVLKSIVVGKNGGLTAKARHLQYLPNWDILKKTNLDD